MAPQPEYQIMYKDTPCIITKLSAPTILSIYCAAVASYYVIYKQDIKHELKDLPTSSSDVKIFTKFVSLHVMGSTIRMFMLTQHRFDEHIVVSLLLFQCILRVSS